MRSAFILVSRTSSAVAFLFGMSSCASQQAAKPNAVDAVEAKEETAPAAVPEQIPEPQDELEPHAFACPSGSGVGTLSVPTSPPERIPGLTNHFDGFGNFEGPVWLDHSLVFSNIAGGTNPPEAVLRRWTGEGDASLLLESAGSNGLALDPAGRLVAARHSDGSVSRLSVTGGESEALVSEFEGKRFNSPNDLTFAADGTFYFSDPTWQAPSPLPQKEARAYVVRQGVAKAVGMVGAPENPNGIAQSLGGDFLYIGGVNGLFRYEVADDGTTRGEGKLVETQSLNAQTGIDGLGRDCAGHLYVTAHSQKLVVVLDSEDREVTAIAVPSSGGVTNVAFGGESGSTLFITSLGEEPQIHRIELGVVGFPY